jgi:hypothetical protein
MYLCCDLAWESCTYSQKSWGLRSESPLQELHKIAEGINNIGILTWELDTLFRRGLAAGAASLLPPYAQPNPRKPHPLLLLALNYAAARRRSAAAAVADAQSAAAALFKAHAARGLFPRGGFVLFVAAAAGLLLVSGSSPPPLQEPAAHGP